MISYAQNAEDVILARLFDEQETGMYVDLGAGHPVYDSVTKHFYDRGWRGVNVEPMKSMFQLLERERAEDTNVHAAVSDREGVILLYEAPTGNLGASTVEMAIADGYARAGTPFTATEVRTITVPSLIDRYELGEIDFVKIDIEGHESTVIHSTDWARVRPRVLVIEAVRPGTTEPSHDEWEGVLLDAGYACTLFDGVNRFYAQEDDDEALKRLSTPANVFDDVEPWRWVSQLEGAKEHIANVEKAREIAERHAEELRDRLQPVPVVRRLVEATRRLIGR
jgi:FkbM family methyltransferase